MASRRNRRYATLATVLAALVLILVGTRIEWRSLLSNDVGWLLYVAQQMLRGDILYRDIIEINPPLIVWLNLPIAWLAQITQLPKLVLLRLAVLCIMLASAALAGMLARHSRTLSTPRTLLLAVLVLITFPFSYFGQREHLIMAFMLPWFLVAMSRMEGGELPRWAPLLSGVFLGLALCLKPHYLLAWLLPLGLVAQTRRSLSIVWKPEQIAAAVTMAGYAGSIPLFAPEYLPLVRRLGGAYLQWLPVTAHTMLLGNPGGVAVIGILLVYAVARTGRSPLDVMALAVVGFLIGVLLQKRGNDYHYYPAVGSGLLLLGFSLGGPARTRRVAGVGFGVLAGTLFLIACSLAFGPEAEEVRGYREFRQAAGPVDATTSVLSLAPRGGLPFELVNHAGAKWALRFPFPIVPAMVYARELDRPAPVVYHTLAERTPLEQWFVSVVLDDAERIQPSLLLIHIPSTLPGSRDLRLDYVAYFSADPRFRALLTQYCYRGQAAGFWIYRRVANHG